MRQDERLVREEVRPFGHVVDVQVTVVSGAREVPFFDERAFEKKDLRLERLARGGLEDPRAGVAREGEERPRAPLRHLFAAQDRGADLLLGPALPRGEEAAPHFRRDEPDRGDPVVGAEGRNGEILAEVDRFARTEPVNRHVVRDSLEPLVEGEDLPPRRHGRRVGEDAAGRLAQEAPLRGPGGEAAGVVEVGVGEEEIRDGYDLRRTAADVESEVERRHVEPRFPPRDRDAPERDSRQSQRQGHPAFALGHRVRITPAAARSSGLYWPQKSDPNSPNRGHRWSSSITRPAS